MENYKILKVYTSALETTLAKGFLEAHGLHPVLHGAKEYSAHITGQDNGRYELLIPDEEFELAQELLRKQHGPQLTTADAPSSLKHESEQGDAKNKNLRYLKKSIYALILSLIIVPILGNAFSIHYLLKIMNREFKIIRLLLLIFNGLIALIWLYYFLLKSIS